MTNSQKINVFMGIVLLILLYILIADKCSSNTLKPAVIKGNDVGKLINLTTAEKQAIDDSFNLVLKTRDWQDEYNYQKYLTVLNENAALYKKNSVLNQPIPDTCRPLMNAWIRREVDLKNLSDKKDVSANITITGLQATVSIQGAFLAAKDSSFSKMKNIADTCAKSLVAMEKYAKKVKARRELNIGIVAISPYTILKPVAGVILGYRGKTGTEINVGYYTNNQISIGLKRSLIKF